MAHPSLPPISERPETATLEPRTRLWPVLLLVMLAGLVAGVLALGFLARMARTGIWEKAAAYATGRSLSVDTSVPAVVSKVQRLQRIETAQFTIDKIVEGARASQVFPDFLAGDRLLLVAHGEVIAGIDLGQVTANDIHIQGKRVEIALPKAQVLVSRLDNQGTRVYSRTTGLLVSADPTLESEVRTRAEEQLREAALQDGILNKARQNASATVTTLMLGLGFEQVDIR